MTFENVHSDILFSINKFLNPVDRFFLQGVCSRLRKYFPAQSKPTIEKLIQYGYLNLLIQYKLISLKIEWMYMAAKYGQLAIIQYFFLRDWSGQEKENGCLWDDYTCSTAAFYGHLNIIQWARSHGCSWNEWTCASAASNEHLNVLQWARVNGCPWNEWTCENAAYKGHLELLKWAIENGCPWNRNHCLMYAKNQEIKDWIVSNS